WSVHYVDFTNPFAPVSKIAKAHDWKLILDLVDPVGVMIAALQYHTGGQQPGDSVATGLTTALRGFSSQAGDNGFGPCPASAVAPEGKKPSPLV
ncbi:MAG: hypothetical protein ABR586_02780, partial [Thermoplasmatota archaeon]